MFTRLFTFGLALVLLACLALPGGAAESGQVKSDEAILKKAEVSSDGPALIDFFRRRIAKGNEEDTIKKHIELLGDRKFSVRKKAMEDLLKIGPPAWRNWKWRSIATTLRCRSVPRS